MISPPFIKSGSKIRIVSPAGKVERKYVLPAVDWLKKQGYKVELGKHVFAQYFQFAGTDEQRLEDLQIAFDDPECDAIICSRGGYGTVRIIDQLDFAKFQKNPRWLVGYSDITTLHSAINKLGIASIHGSMPPFFLNDLGEANENLKSVINILNGKSVHYKIETNNFNRKGNSTGELIGGNLSIITSLLGTEYELKTKGKILFIEETDEYLYHIDRMMHQLKLAGDLKNLIGLVVGDFTNSKDNDSPFGQTVEEIIMESVKGYNFPVCFGFPAGHEKINLALAYGRNWELDVFKNGVSINLEL